MCSSKRKNLGSKQKEKLCKRVGCKKGDRGPFVEKAAQITAQKCVKGWVAVVVVRKRELGRPTLHGASG